MMCSPPRTMVSVVLMVGTLLLAASGPGRCESYQPEYGGDYEDGCHPEEADLCFTDVNQNLLCNLGKPNTGRNCTNRDAHDLCTGMSDALLCCEDILETCAQSDTFEVWLIGLRAVHRHLCHNDHMMASLKVLLQGSKCFRLKKFLNCVEERAKLTHIADLLTNELDLLECNKIQVAVAACIEDSEKNKRNCQGTSLAATEALTAFFTATECGQVLQPTQPPPPLLPCSPTSAPGSSDDNNNNSSTTNTNSTNNEDNKNNTATNTTTLKTPTTTTTTDSTTTINNTSKSNPKDTSTASSTTIITTTNTSKASPQVACQKKDLNTSGTPTASTVVVTMLVTLVLVGLAAMLLLKRGILIIRTDLDRRLIGLNDDDGNSAYDRF